MRDLGATIPVIKVCAHDRVPVACVGHPRPRGTMTDRLGISLTAAEVRDNDSGNMLAKANFAPIYFANVRASYPIIGASQVRDRRRSRRAR
jgi:hypothetical protein